MKKDELRALYLNGFDHGLIGASEQLRTTLQMREMAIKAHKKHLAEIDGWIKNQEAGLQRQIAEIEMQKND